MRIPSNFRRITSAITAVALALATVIPHPSLLAQTPVPSLTPQGFDEAEYAALYNSAAGAGSVSEWQALIDQGLATSPPWEATLDTEIAGHVGAVTDSDAYNNTAAYQDYLAAQLELQKGADVAQWNAGLSAQEEYQRQVYLAALMSNYSDEMEQEANAAGSNASWQDQFDYDYYQGLREFETALSAVDQEYATTISELDQQDAIFQQRLAEIQQYEDTVRSNITAQVTNLTNFLSSSGMFYDGGGNLNAAGLQLQTLLDDVNDGLNNGTALSTISDQIATYMEARETDALQEQADWTAASTWNANTSNTIAIGSLSVWLDSYPEVVGIMNYVLDGDASTAIDQIRGYMGYDSAVDITITGADAIGFSYSYPPTAQWGGETLSSLPDNPHDYYGTTISTKWAAFTYIASGCFGPNVWNPGPCGYPASLPEQYTTITYDFTATDTNAVANAATWGGYAAALGPMANTWRNDVIPAIQNWESQTAALEANYSAWQAEASSLRSQAESQYAQSRTAILGERSQWLGEVTRIANAGESLSRSAQTSTEEELAPAPLPVVPRVTAQSIYNRNRDSENSLAAARSLGRDTLSNLTSPDTSALENFLETTQRSLTGLQNLAYTESIQLQAEEARQQTIDMLVGMVTQDNVQEERQEIDYNPYEDVPVLLRPEGWENVKATRLETNEEMQERIENQRARNYTDVKVGKDGTIIASRAIKTGEAVWNGGDLTNTDGYSAAYETQTVTIRPPQAIKLASGGDLFASWDYDELQESHEENLSDFYAGLDRKVQAAQGQLANANELFTARETAFQQNAASQAQTWSMIKSLVTSMMGGMDLGSALVDYAKNQIIGQVASQIETMTGIPAGFMSSILGGANIEQAMQSYAWQVVGSHIDEVTGISGLGSQLTGMLQKQMAKKAARNGPMGKLANSMAAMTMGGGFGAMAGFMMGGPMGMLAGAAMGAATGGAMNEAGAAGFAAPMADVFYENPMLMDATAYATASATGNPGVWYGYQAMKGSYMGGTVGALTSMADSALMATQLVGVDASISYTFDDGFGGSLGIGGEYGSIGVNYSERNGVGAYGRLGQGEGLSIGFSVSEHGGNSINAGYSSGGVNLGVSYSDQTGFGANAGFGGEIADGVNGNLGLSWSETEGVGANAGITYGNGDIDSMLGGGLSYTQNSGLSASLTVAGGTLGTITADGFQYNANFAKDAAGAALKKKYVEDRKAERAEELEKTLEENRKNMSPEERAAFDKLKSVEDKVAFLKEKAEQGGDDAVVNDAYGESWDSQDGLTGLLGSFDLGQDMLNFANEITGTNSDNTGYIDERGDFHVRTCFPAWMPVTVEGGHLEEIQNVRAGDRVLTFNEKTGEFEYKPVRTVWERQTHEFHELTFEDGVFVETTWSHPFYVKDRGWVPAHKLQPGDLVHTRASLAAQQRQDNLIHNIQLASLSEDNLRESGLDPPLRLLTVNVTLRSETVYNLDVEDNDNFFVSSARILVHNQNHYDDAGYGGATFSADGTSGYGNEERVGDDSGPTEYEQFIRATNQPIIEIFPNEDENTSTPAAEPEDTGSATAGTDGVPAETTDASRQPDNPRPQEPRENATPESSAPQPEKVTPGTTLWEDVTEFFTAPIVGSSSIADLALDSVEFIPVVGDIVGAARSGIELATAVSNGDWPSAGWAAAGVGLSIVGLIPGIGDAATAIKHSMKHGADVLKHGDDVLKHGDDVLKHGDDIIRHADDLPTRAGPDVAPGANRPGGEAAQELQDRQRREQIERQERYGSDEGSGQTQPQPQQQQQAPDGRPEFGQRANQGAIGTQNEQLGRGNAGDPTGPGYTQAQSPGEPRQQIPATPSDNVNRGEIPPARGSQSPTGRSENTKSQDATTTGSDRTQEMRAQQQHQKQEQMRREAQKKAIEQEQRRRQQNELIQQQEKLRKARERQQQWESQQRQNMQD